MKKNSSGFAQILVIFLVLVGVAAGAYYFVGIRENPVVISSPSPTPISTRPPMIEPPLDKTSSWKTYTNPFAGFSVKYPREFSFQNGTTVLQYPTNDYNISFETEITNLSIEQWIQNKNICPNAGSVKLCSDQQSGPIVNSAQFDDINRHYAATETIFRNGGTIFRVRLNAVNPNVPISDEAKNLYNQILSTFKFLDNTDETFCKADSDCGIEFCGCNAKNKEFINQSKNICTVVCGTAKCVNNKCELQPYREP